MPKSKTALKKHIATHEKLGILGTSLVKFDDNDKFSNEMRQNGTIDMLKELEMIKGKFLEDVKELKKLRYRNKLSKVEFKIRYNALEKESYRKKADVWDAIDARNSDDQKFKLSVTAQAIQQTSDDLKQGLEVMAVRGRKIHQERKLLLAEYEKDLETHPLEATGNFVETIKKSLSLHRVDIKSDYPDFTKEELDFYTERVGSTSNRNVQVVDDSHGYDEDVKNGSTDHDSTDFDKLLNTFKELHFD